MKYRVSICNKQHGVQNIEIWSTDLSQWYWLVIVLIIICDGFQADDDTAPTRERGGDDNVTVRLNTV